MKFIFTFKRRTDNCCKAHNMQSFFIVAGTLFKNTNNLKHFISISKHVLFINTTISSGFHV